MKKILVLSLMAGSFLMVAQQSFAQNEPITSKTATPKKGYTIINKGEPIVLYKYIHRIHSPKEAEKFGPKYFFSTEKSNLLQPLTKENVKKAFPDNHPFHDAIDATFRDDKDLSSYDEYHKMYKINWLLKQHS